MITMTRTYPKYGLPSGNWTTDPEHADRLWAKWAKEGKVATTMPSTCEPVGGLEVAARLGMRPKTVTQWKLRGLLPAPRWTVSGEDAWDWHEDIEPWAARTGRLRQHVAEPPVLDPLCWGGDHAGCIGPPGTRCECPCHTGKCDSGRLANGSLCKLPGHVHSPWWCEFCPHPEICAPAERCFDEQHGLNYDTDEDGAPRG